MSQRLRDKIDELLRGALSEALKSIECRTLKYGGTLSAAEASLSKVSIAHILGLPEARYLVESPHSRLELYVQLNVYRLVVVYRVPALGTLNGAALQPRFERWALGARDAGWTVDWRDAFDDTDERCIEVYCYAALPLDFMEDERHQLYWITDVVQMTRSFVLEARRAGVRLDAGRRGKS